MKYILDIKDDEKADKIVYNKGILKLRKPLLFAQKH